MSALSSDRPTPQQLSDALTEACANPGGDPESFRCGGIIEAKSIDELPEAIRRVLER